MAEKDKKPEIRFTGFTDAWEQHRLGEYFEERTQRSGEGELISVTMNSGVVKASELNRHDNSSNDKSNYKKVEVGDIAYNSMRMWQGASGYSPYSGILSPAYTVVIPTEGVYSPFFAYMFKRPEMTHKFTMNSQGLTSDTWNLKFPSFSTIETKAPEYDEQVKIADFFKHLDCLITLHQRKYDKLVIVKKSMLEKMFPKVGANVPEIRFAGFTDAWKQWKVGDVLTEKQRPIKMEDDEEYQLVTVKRRNEGIVSRGYLKGKEILVKNYFEIRSGDYLISKRQVVHGANGIVPENLDKSIVSNEYLVAIGNKNITTEYWALISKRPDMYKQFLLSSYGVDIEKLVFDVEDWKKRTIILPSLPEQERITLFFKQMDNLITLHQRELEKLKNIKKSMLEKMFV